MAPSLTVLLHPSPNYDSRGGREVNLIVLHADGDARIEDALAYCCRTDVDHRVSYHADVGRTGNVYQLVADEQNAWHAGKSRFDERSTVHSWRLASDCVNKHSLGLALSNRQDGKERFPEAQLDAAARWCAAKMRAFPAVTLERITTHHSVAIPPGRKVDPAPAGPFDLDDFLLRVQRELARG